MASGGQDRDSHTQQSGGFPGSQWTTRAGVGQGQALVSTWPLHLGSIPPRLFRVGTTVLGMRSGAYDEQPAAGGCRVSLTPQVVGTGERWVVPLHWGAGA